LYSPTIPNDANSAKAADHKNAGRWEQARTLEQQMFEGYQSTLGITHVSTLTAAVDLTITTATLGYLADAERWVDWVIQIGAGTLGMKHPLLLKINRIKGEIMASKGQYAEAENLISGVLVDQQDLLGVDHLDTLETERALGDTCQRMGRQQDAEARMRHRVETLTKRLGRDHVLVARALLDLFLALIYPEITASLNTNNNNPWIPTVSGNRLQLEQAASSVGELHGRLRACLGAQHPLTIHALRVLGQAKAAQGQTTEASDMFRRALHNAEEVLGQDNPETLAIVCQIGLLYNKRDQEVAQVTAVQQVINRGSGAGGAPSTARPWFERYADWLDRRVGLVIPATREVLCVLAMSYMAEQKLVEAEKYLERLVCAYQQDPKVANSPEAVQAANLLQSCRMNTMWMRSMGNGSGSGNDGGDLVGMLGRLGFYSDYSSSDGSNYLW
jgi:tetratricopeptide (TPR) repeat protein